MSDEQQRNLLYIIGISVIYAILRIICIRRAKMRSRDYYDIRISFFSIVWGAILLFVLRPVFGRRLPKQKKYYVFLSYSTQTKKGAALLTHIKAELTRSGISYFDYLIQPVEQSGASTMKIQSNLEDAITRADCSIEIRSILVNNRSWIEYERSILRNSTIPRVFLCVDEWELKSRSKSRPEFLINFWDGQRNYTAFTNQYVKILRSRGEDVANGDCPYAYSNGFNTRAIEMRMRSRRFVRLLVECLENQNWNLLRQLEADLHTQWNWKPFLTNQT
jgi:hypothetical protein